MPTSPSTATSRSWKEKASAVRRMHHQDTKTQSGQVGSRKMGRSAGGQERSWGAVGRVACRSPLPWSLYDNLRVAHTSRLFSSGCMRPSVGSSWPILSHGSGAVMWPTAQAVGSGRANSALSPGRGDRSGGDGSVAPSEAGKVSGTWRPTAHPADHTLPPLRGSRGPADLRLTPSRAGLGVTSVRRKLLTGNELCTECPEAKLRRCSRTR